VTEPDRVAALIDENLKNAVALKEAYQPAPEPPGGASIYVPAGGNLQAALDAAVGPLTIRLERGATYTGNFRLPARGDTAAVVLTTDGELPVPTPARPWITPSEAAPFAKLVVQDPQAPALYCQDGAHDWTLDAIEILPNGAHPERTLVEMSGGAGEPTSLAQVPARIVIDRCYVHGDETVGGRRGVAFQVADGRITRSYFERFFHDAEAQAIAIWCGPGPFLIESNYL
jgi:hypothetical protein